MASSRMTYDTDRLFALGPTLLKELSAKVLDSDSTFKFDGCIVTTRTPAKWAPQIGKNSKNYYCTGIILAHYKGKPEFNYMQASHLCGNRLCVNPTHLMWELPWDNVAREGCHKYNHFATCPHDPPCLPSPDFDAVVTTRQHYIDKCQTKKRGPKSSPEKAKTGKKGRRSLGYEQTGAV